MILQRIMFLKRIFPLVMCRTAKTLCRKKSYFNLDHKMFSTTPITHLKDNNIQILKSNRNSNCLTCGSQLSKFLDKEVTLYGWVNRISNETFELRDGFGLVRCFLIHELMENKIYSDLHQAVVKVLGTVSSRNDSDIENFNINGDVEIKIKWLNILQQWVSFDKAVLYISEMCFTGNLSKSYNKNDFSYRTHTCGEITNKHIGNKVTLCGWLKYWRSPRFLILGDAYGTTQCTDLDEKFKSIISKINLESVLLIEGIVIKRPAETVNVKMITGEVEVLIENIKLLNPASDLAFNLRNYQKATEKLSLKHRYLSLRFPEMQYNLRTRSNMVYSMRKFLIDHNGFVEVETPTLFCRTPGGAREFIVPTHNGDFFCLVQSPQQFKQMLMVGGVDRYFQVARCYRDESTRTDRQPEFTQLDIEVSFAKLDDIMNLVEKLIVFSYPKTLSSPFPRITYLDALEKYGSDKPDISYGLNLRNITDLMEKVPESNKKASCLVIKQTDGYLSNTFSRSLRKDLSKLFLDVQILYCRVPDNLDTFKSQEINNIIPTENMKLFISRCDLKGGDHFFIACGHFENMHLCLGACRTKIASEFLAKGTLERNTDLCQPLWITNFPLFVRGKDGTIESCHHPFTAPHEDDLSLLNEDPFKVRALSYDLVIDGQEVGGGSVRAHSAELQEKLLRMLQIEPKSLQHMLRALQSGCPPHAGIALGLDRLAMLACGAHSIRDVIAFPKSSDGTDPLSGAPSPVSEDDLQYYKIKSVKPS